MYPYNLDCAADANNLTHFLFHHQAQHWPFGSVWITHLHCEYFCALVFTCLKIAANTFSFATMCAAYLDHVLKAEDAAICDLVLLAGTSCFGIGLIADVRDTTTGSWSDTTINWSGSPWVGASTYEILPLEFLCQCCSSPLELVAHQTSLSVGCC